jgi:transposase
MDKHIERLVAREAQAMTRQQIILRAVNGELTWTQAASILRITPRHLRRLHIEYEVEGLGALVDHRKGRTMRTRIPAETIREVCRLKRDEYPDFSMKHFHEQLTEKHDIDISYTWTRVVLQDAGIVEKAPGRGKYRRHRERRPMRGMLLHIDASTHTWIPGLPQWDLNVVLDDADGQILYARFFEEEGLVSTFDALKHVLQRWGRFCELYHDQGSHFGVRKKQAEGLDEERTGQVTRALKVLGIRQIFARSPQARGRSERAFGTIQGRLPQELRKAGIETYEQANVYLQDRFISDFNRRFTVAPAQPESAFTPLTGVDLELLLSAQHERIVRNDNTVSFRRTILQIPQDAHRLHFVRCPVVVHEFCDGSLGVSYQGRPLGHYTGDGERIKILSKSKKEKRKSKARKAA